jgi:hypothetical protein
MGKRVKAPLLGATVAAAAFPAGAAGEERTSRGTIGAATVDNLRVPQRANCVLKGTRVRLERGGVALREPVLERP